MASFDEHILQAKNNLTFLIEVNSKNITHWDWQVTICFYVGVHIINAHIAKSANLHYRTHEDVKNSISPYSKLSLVKLPEDIYLAYARLEGLSRRSRYLCHEDFANKDQRAFLTYDKHLAKAVKNLDVLLDYFKYKYSIQYPTLRIICSELSSKTPLKIFSL